MVPGETMRLFIAIDLPETVKRSLVGLCSGVPGGRWVNPEQLHLTLRFIGEVDRALFDRIRVSLSSVASPPVTLILNSVGSFPSTGTPRVLWVGIQRSGALASLYDRVENALVAAGCEAEMRHFSPHITLARLKDVPRSHVVPYLAEHAGFSEGPVDVKEFCLYSSRQSRQGSHHTVEASFPLSATGAP